MCEFCKKHGDGTIWYKNALNYSEDLLSDLRRKRFIKHFFDIAIDRGFKNLTRLQKIFNKKGKLPDQLTKKMVEDSKIEHFGQVVPIEEVKEIVDKALEIVRLPCACRWVIDRREIGCCYGLTYNPKAWYRDLDMSFFDKPNSNLLEIVDKNVAIKHMEEIEKRGAIHTIWTFVTPFIGAICNCSIRDCLALRTYKGIGVETILRAEYRAVVDINFCNGCGICLGVCPFNAVDSFHREGRYFAQVDPDKCFGCGLCRNVCEAAAINLQSRI
ncbi:MAG: 4Fe-4S binding protein [Thermodesulfovibrionales bacterium]|nr:4Fe-4S binding protein [Thermodesulfovibrionales bacterium]